MSEFTTALGNNSDIESFRQHLESGYYQLSFAITECDDQWDVEYSAAIKNAIDKISTAINTYQFLQIDGMSATKEAIKDCNKYMPTEVGVDIPVEMTRALNKLMECCLTTSQNCVREEIELKRNNKLKHWKELLDNINTCCIKLKENTNPENDSFTIPGDEAIQRLESACKIMNGLAKGIVKPIEREQ